MILQHPPQLGITLPLTSEYFRAAQAFAQQCPFDDKAEQIRQNTLAVCAVNAYLQLIDIPTALAQSDSWNPMMQMMANVADLKLPGVGTLSCRLVSPEATTCHIPPEDWQDRAGYIAVAIDEPARAATLVGFTATAPTTEAVPLDRFAPIETLIDEIHTLQMQVSENSLQNTMIGQAFSQQAQSVLTQLNAWLEGTISASWQAVDTLINPPELGFAFRGTELTSRPSNDSISRAKLVDLGIQLGQSIRVALVVQLSQVDNNNTDIVLQVRPLGDSPYLMEGLNLKVLDDQGNIISSVISRAIDNYIQLRISGQPQEQFAVELTAGERSFKEQFVI